MVEMKSSKQLLNSALAWGREFYSVTATRDIQELLSKAFTMVLMSVSRDGACSHALCLSGSQRLPFRAASLHLKMDYIAAQTARGKYLEKTYGSSLVSGSSQIDTGALENAQGSTMLQRLRNLKRN